jgi:hypothetical protein
MYPDGDTILSLLNPGNPFAIPSNENERPNALPQFQSSESKYQESTIVLREGVTADSVDGLTAISTLERGEPEKKRIHLTLSSQCLRAASKYFEKLMSGDWREAQPGSSSKWTVEAVGWDHEALSMLMKIIHHQTRSVPRTLPLEMLAKIAVLVDYYDCHVGIEPWAEIWIPNLGTELPTYYCRDILLRLLVAWTFSEHAVFRSLTQVIILRSRGPIHTLGLPIRQTIIGQ